MTLTCLRRRTLRSSRRHFICCCRCVLICKRGCRWGENRAPSGKNTSKYWTFKVSPGLPCHHTAFPNKIRTPTLDSALSVRISPVIPRDPMNIGTVLYLCTRALIYQSPISQRVPQSLGPIRAAATSSCRVRLRRKRHSSWIPCRRRCEASACKSGNRSCGSEI